ncbi:MAG: sodium:solute symporter [Chlorobi bacterium]|nr:sodium:solute symporter [Chlorobiota bacterium]
MTNIASYQLAAAGWVLILIYMSVILFFVIRGAKKTKNISDYAVGSVNFSPVTVGLSLAASMTSAATFIINPGIIALYGISGVISYGIILPAAALTSLVILTKGFRKYGKSIKALTLAQWIGERYESGAYKLFMAVISLLLITFIVLINVGLTKVISKTLNVEETYVLLGITVFIFGYMMFGGANSMVYTNTVQAVLMLVVAFILLGSGYHYFSEGVRGFLDRLNEIDPKLTQFTNDSGFLFRDFFEIVIAQIIVGAAIVCQPHIITKSLLLKKEKDVNKYLIVAVVTETIFFAVVFVGLYARLSFPDLSVNGTPLKLDGIVSAYVVKEFPVFIGLIVVMGLISAGLSTLEGLIQSLSSTITNDIIKPIFLKNEAKKTIAVNRMAVAFLGVVSALLSYNQLVNPKLSVAIFAQNGVYAFFAAAFLPILLGMFRGKIKKSVPITASITALVVHFIMYYGKIAVPFTKSTGENPGVAAATAIIVSLLIAGSIYLFDKKAEYV